MVATIILFGCPVLINQIQSVLNPSFWGLFEAGGIRRSTAAGDDPALIDVAAGGASFPGDAPTKRVLAFALKLSLVAYSCNR